MIRFKLIILSVLLSCTLSSCLKMDEELTLRKDGSAQMILSYSIPLEHETLLSNMETVLRRHEKQKTSKKRLPVSRIFDRQAVLKHFHSFKGVKVESFRSYSFEGQRHAYIKLSFTDFSKALKKGALQHRSYTKKDGIMEYRVKLNILKPEKKELASLKRLLKGTEINIKVQTQGLIKESNALPKNTKGNAVSWIYNDQQETHILNAPKELFIKL